MRWLLWTVGAFAAIVAGVYGIGWMLPMEHVARVERVIAKPLDQVAGRIRDVGAYEKWRAVRVEILSEEEGRTRYRETSGEDTITFDLVEAAASRRFTSTIVDKDLPFEGSWRIDLEAKGEGTLVAIEERGRVKDPLYRFLSQFVFGHTAAMEAYLDALAAAA